MKALSLTQPWASLVAMSAKQVETRSWTTAHRGRIAIHAAKGFPRSAKDLCEEAPFNLFTPDWKTLPLGAIVGVATIVDVIKSEKWRSFFAVRSGWENEKAFGDYSDARYGWYFRDIKLLPEPIPCKGALGLWKVPAEIKAQIKAIGVV